MNCLKANLPFCLFKEISGKKIRFQLKSIVNTSDDTTSLMAKKENVNVFVRKTTKDFRQLDEMVEMAKNTPMEF